MSENNLKTNLKIGEKYKSFEVLNVFDVSDYHSVAVHLRHSKTGLEVFHLVNDDSENLFAFVFRTPNKKSTGLAHIIEHSVLCGSEKYPLKDPFIVLSNQSVKTYLNAMTYPDKTVYPASSISSADYFNLMSVYGDAVFFPLLKKEIFMQEAHRFEVGEDGSVSIQGVVYNEMKGSYSSFESVASDVSLSSLLGGSIYEKDSGGDPLEIPDSTYEDFLNFHKTWYRPDNCLVFLSGNIPTEEQLDFLQDTFLNRLEKKYPDIDVSPEAREKRLADFLSLVTPNEMEGPVTLYETAPSSEGEEKNTVLLNWNLGKSADALSVSEKLVLTGILCNHDGSPLQKALLESGLGEDTAPQTGLLSSIYNSVFSVGLRGVKPGDEKTLENLILKTIEGLFENGIPQKDVESTLATLEFSHREIKRGHGPFALSLMSRPIFGWLYGYGFENQIRLRSHLDEIKNRIEKNPDYLKNLLKNLLLENKNRSLVIVSPSENFAKERQAAEKNRIEQYLKNHTVDEIALESEKLHAFQSGDDDPSCLPHLKPGDFIKDGKPVMNRVNTEISSLSGCDGSCVPLIKNIENTNGIIYFDIAFPADVLPPSDYLILPSFANCVSECGWKNLDWSKASESTALYTGGLGVNLLTMDGPKTKNAKTLAEKYDWINRDWVIFRTSFLEEKAENALSLLGDCIATTDFSDKKRIRDILNESRNDLESSIIPDGHIYVSNRVSCTVSKKSAVDEIWNGLRQYQYLKNADFASDSLIDEITKNFNRILAELKNGGALIHITAETSGFDKIKGILSDFVRELQICAPKNALDSSDEDFFSLTKLEGENSGENSDDFSSRDEAFTVSTPVGFAATSVPASRYEDENSYAEEVAAHWLSNNLLWEKIRTIGGAYGAFCNTESFNALLVFATYRDPSPLESCATFIECLKEAGETDFSEEECESAIMGCYNQFIQPQSPKGRGSSALTKILYGITDEDREKKILGILRLHALDLKMAFRRLYENTKSEEAAKFIRKSIICDKKSLEGSDFSGKIINLPL